MKNYLLTFAVLLSVVSLAVMQANAAVTVEEATTDASAQYWLNPAYEQYYSLVARAAPEAFEEFAAQNEPVNLAQGHHGGHGGHGGYHGGHGGHGGGHGGHGGYHGGQGGHHGH